LGTGGGTGMVATQKLTTAGTWINIEGHNLYLDPGPSCLYQINKFGLSAAGLQTVLVTHKHLDHVGELEALIDAMNFNGGRFKNQAIAVLKPKDVLINNYHKKLVNKLVNVKANSRYKVRNLNVRTTKLLLEKPFYFGKLEEYGFVLEKDRTKIAFIPETYWQKNLFKGIKADILVLNNLRDKKEDQKMIVATIKEINPKIVLMRHWILPVYEKGIKKFAGNIEKLTQIKTIAVQDGDIFDIKNLKI